MSCALKRLTCYLNSDRYNNQPERCRQYSSGLPVAPVVLLEEEVNKSNAEREQQQK